MTQAHHWYPSVGSTVAGMDSLWSEVTHQKRDYVDLDRSLKRDQSFLQS